MFEIIFIVCTLGSTPQKIEPFGQCWMAMDQPLFQSREACMEQSKVLVEKLKGTSFPVEYFSICKQASTT